MLPITDALIRKLDLEEDAMSFEANQRSTRQRGLIQRPRKKSLQSQEPCFFSVLVLMVRIFSTQEEQRDRDRGAWGRNSAWDQVAEGDFIVFREPGETIKHTDACPEGRIFVLSESRKVPLPWVHGTASDTSHPHPPHSRQKLSYSIYPAWLHSQTNFPTTTSKHQSRAMRIPGKSCSTRSIFFKSFYECTELRV